MKTITIALLALALAACTCPSKPGYRLDDMGMLVPIEQPAAAEEEERE